MNLELKPLLPRNLFFKRLFRSILLGLLIIILALAVGMMGYHYLEGLSWLDAFENASMILSGMGPVTPLTTNSCKIFAGLYALFSGTLFLVIIALVFAPVIHRFLHTFHIEPNQSSGK